MNWKYFYLLITIINSFQSGWSIHSNEQYNDLKTHAKFTHLVIGTYLHSIPQPLRKESRCILEAFNCKNKQYYWSHVFLPKQNLMIIFQAQSHALVMHKQRANTMQFLSLYLVTETILYLLPLATRLLPLKGKWTGLWTGNRQLEGEQSSVFLAFPKFKKFQALHLQGMAHSRPTLS